MNTIQQSVGDVQVNTLEWAYGLSLNSALTQEKATKDIRGTATTSDSAEPRPCTVS